MVTAASNEEMDPIMVSFVVYFGKADFAFIFSLPARLGMMFGPFLDVADRQTDFCSLALFTKNPSICLLVLIWNPH